MIGPYLSRLIIRAFSRGSKPETSCFRLGTIRMETAEIHTVKPLIRPVPEWQTDGCYRRFRLRKNNDGAGKPDPGASAALHGKKLPLM